MRGSTDKWHSKEMQKAFETCQWNAFGFQVSRNETTNKLHLHVAKPFMQKQNNAFSSIDETAFLNGMGAKLGWTAKRYKDIWITDFLGRLWITINIEKYNEIPQMFDAATTLGYTLITHTKIPVSFVPGDTFTLRNMELKMIQQIERGAEMVKEFRPHTLDTEKALYEYVLDMGSCAKWVVTRPYNWTTLEGNEFCARMRRILGKRKEPKNLEKTCRLKWLHYIDTIQEMGVLEAGTWSAAQLLSVSKKHKKEKEECMICLDAEPDTCVLPCGHCVVCDTCSKALENSNVPDKTICCQCRMKITHVLYKDGTQLKLSF